AIGTFFTLLAKRQLISPAASDRMLARLERQQINDRLPAQLPGGVVVAHKTGNLSGVTHDAGVIYTKTGPRVVVAMTWDALDEDAANFISSIGSRSEEHTSELQSPYDLVCRLLLEKKKTHDHRWRVHQDDGPIR